MDTNADCLGTSELIKMQLIKELERYLKSPDVGKKSLLSWKKLIPSVFAFAKNLQAQEYQSDL